MRENLAYKLPGVAGSHTSTEDICKDQERNISSTEDRQHNSSCLYKQSRGNGIQGACLLNSRPVDVVPGEEHSHPSTTLTRDPELLSRSGVEVHERSIRLETGSTIICENQPTVWPTGSGPVCVQANQPVPTLLQLATRSVCGGNGRVSSGLDNLEGLRQPSLEPNTSGPEEISGSTGRGGSCSPCLEGTAMVCPPPSDASRLATPPTYAINRDSHGTNPTVSRMEHLRERLSCQGLSDQATDLVLKSWRTKTNRSYDSLFGRWNRWCGERGSNPFSGPVSEVANFLASLYQEGYQYNSVNAYRSAISSVHEKVDGVPIGQHPLVTRLIKGIFNVRPPMPRYSSTWDVQVILDYLESCGQSENLTLKLLTLLSSLLLPDHRDLQISLS